MTIYFSSKNIPALQNLTIKQRRELIKKAEKKFTVPEKLLLNLIKLGILVPMFLYLVWLSGWQLILPPVFALVGYLFVYRSFFYFFIVRKL
jgi:hypothetical protein